MRRRVICKQFGIDLGQHLPDLRIHQLPAVRHDKVAVAIHRRPVVMGLVRRCNQEYPPVRCLVVQLIKSRSSHRTRKDIACMGTDNSPHSALLFGHSYAEKRLQFPLQHIRMGRIELTGHRRMPVYFDILSIHTQSICLLRYLYNNRQPGFDFDLSHDKIPVTPIYLVNGTYRCLAQK